MKSLKRKRKKKINKNKIHLIVSAITSSQEAFIKACICKCEKVICERKKKKGEESRYNIMYRYESVDYSIGDVWHIVWEQSEEIWECEWCESKVVELMLGL